MYNIYAEFPNEKICQLDTNLFIGVSDISNNASPPHIPIFPIKATIFCARPDLSLYLQKKYG